MALPLYHIQHVFISLIYHAALLLRLCLTLCMTVAYQAPLPWDFPHKNTGVGCHGIHGIFPPRSMGSSPKDWTRLLHLLHYRGILCPLSHLGSHAIYYTQNHAFKLKYYYNILKHLNVTEKLQEKYEELQYCTLEKN